MSDDEAREHIGKTVSIEVTWPNQRKSWHTGKLEQVRDGEAFVESDIGFVVGPVDSMEVHDD